MKRGAGAENIINERETAPANAIFLR